MKRKIWNLHVLTACLVTSCASPRQASLGTILFDSDSGGAIPVEVLVLPNGDGSAFGIRAQAIMPDSNEEAWVLLALRATLFEDIDGNELLGDEDRQLGRVFCESSTPFSFLQVGSLSVAPDAKGSLLRIQVEVETTFDKRTVVVEL